MRPLAFSFSLTVLLAACSRNPDPPPPPKPAAAPRLQPALNRGILLAYTSSLLDPDRPKIDPAGPAASTDALAASVERSNAFARKYGFHDFAEYTEASRRVLLAKLAWMKRGLVKSSGGNIDLQIDTASRTLMNPDATEEQKKSASEALSRALQLKRIMEAPTASSVVAEEDIALVGEFADQIEAAENAAELKR